MSLFKANYRTRIFTVSENQHPGLTEVVERLTRELDATPVGRWNLELLQFRSSASSTDAASRGGVAAPSFLQVLSLSTRTSLPEATVTTTIEAQPQSTIAIAPDQIGSFLQVVASKLGGLWAPRPPLQVSAGLVWDLGGEFFIRIGELRQAGNQTAPRGLIFVIEEVDSVSEGEQGAEDTKTVRDENGVADDLSVAQDVLRGVWNSFGIEGAKEFIRRSPRDPKASRFSEAQVYCEALRLRS